jgi:hypothetical protein
MNEKPTLADIYRTIKKPVLILLNGKAPIKGDWPRFTYEYTQSVAYQRELNCSTNIGIVLGERSGGLCSIDFDTDAFLKWFLEHNPKLADSFRVVGARGAQIYAYIEGQRPTKVCGLEAPEEHFLAVGAKKKEKPNGWSHIGEFRAEKGQSVLIGIHPISKHPYHWPVDNPPITIAFEDIVWHPDIVLPWVPHAAAAKAHSTSFSDNVNGNHERNGEPGGSEAIQEATRVISIDFLWEYFKFPPRKKRSNGEYENPIPSPFRDDNTIGHDSFSIYRDKDDQNRQRFKDHNAAYEGDENRGDSFDFYQRATGKDSHEAFYPFMQLAEWVAGGEEIPPYSADSGDESGPSGSTGERATESEEEALEKETRRVEEWYGKKTTSTPAPIREEAFIGFAGRWVKIAAEQTECNRDCLLAHFLACVGVLFGRYFYTFLGQNIFANEFLIVLGDSASGRKGTALFEVQRFMALVETFWHHKVRKSIQSGEAVVHFTRDKVEGFSRGKTPVKIVKDEGVEDKRLLIVEPELSHFFKISERNGNSLTEKLRDAYDCPDLLQNSNKNSPETATNPYVSMIGHITEAELKTTNPTNIISGYINRNTYVHAFRAQRIPNSRPIQWPKELVDELVETIRLAQRPSGSMSVEELSLDLPDQIKEIPFDEEAQILWEKLHAEDGTENGPMRVILERRLAHIRKFSLKYAILDRSPVQTSAHLLAGVALQDHSDALAVSVFADFGPNKLANKILTALNRESPKGLTKTRIYDEVARNNASKSDMNEALSILSQNKLAHVTLKKFDPKANKPTEVWFAGQKTTQ